MRYNNFPWKDLNRRLVMPLMGTVAGLHSPALFTGFEHIGVVLKFKSPHAVAFILIVFIEYLFMRP